MPYGRGPGPRRIIPIQQRKTSSIRFVTIGDRVEQVEVGRKQSVTVWASCQTKDDDDQMQRPQFITRVISRTAGVVTFKVAEPMKFSSSCIDDKLAEKK